MGCLICEQLSAEFERLKECYYEARNYLDGTADTSELADYTQARFQANKAWTESEAARVDLERHRQAHQRPNSVAQ